MFSDHLPKIEQTSRGNFFLIAGVLVLACQLLAMVVVAEGQVKKAELRESQLQSERMVVAQCIENVKGAALSTCSARGSFDDRQATSLSQMDDSTRDHSQSALRSAVDGLFAVSFAAR